MKERVKYRAAGYKLEHVVIAEKVLGHPLPRGARVHHVDGNGLNNANSNLVIYESHKYHHLLHIRQRIVDIGGDPNTHKICSGCGLCLRTEFWELRRNTDGLCCYYKKCGKARHRILTQQPEHKRKANERRNERRRAARAHKRTLHSTTGSAAPELQSLLQSALRQR